MSNHRLVSSGLLFCVSLHTGAARGQDCINLFDPYQVHTLNITMDPADWDTLRFSCPGGACPPPPHSYFVGFLSCENSPLMLVGVYGLGVVLRGRHEGIRLTTVLWAPVYVAWRCASFILAWTFLDRSDLPWKREGDRNAQSVSPEAAPTESPIST